MADRGLRSVLDGLLRDSVARQHATDGEDGQEEAGHEQRHRDDEQNQDKPACGCHGGTLYIAVAATTLTSVSR